MEGKAILDSKTIWVNAILAIAAFFPGVSQVVTADVAIQLIAFINIVLRFLTKGSIGLN